MNKYPVLILFVSLLFAISCKKTNSATAPVPACPATLYGYIGTEFDRAVFTYGTVDQQTGEVKRIANFLCTAESYSAVFNTADNCYYVFDNSSFSLLKFSLSGVTTTFTAQLGYSAFCFGLAYNKVTKSYYSIAMGGILVMNLGDSTYTYSSALGVDLTNPVQFDPVVDNSTGNMYYTVSTANGYYLEKYETRLATSVIIDSESTTLIGLQFNSNDNMLYAVSVSDSSSGTDFIKIDPSSGAITTLGYMPFNLPALYSTIIDPCTNEYIISYTLGYPSTDSCFIDHYDLTGHRLQHTQTNGIIQGLQFGY